MKRIFFLIFLTLMYLEQNSVYAQANANNDSTASLNLVASPSSPGFTILGIAPSDVDRPSSPTDFKASILNATNDLSIVPKNYALEFSPAWIFFGKRISYNSYAADNNAAQNIFQTLAISVATATGSQATDTRIGIGFKCSVFRGTIDASFQDYQKKISKVFLLLDSLNNNFSLSLISTIAADPLYHSYENILRTATSIQDSALALQLINDRTQKISDSLLNSSKQLAANIASLKSIAGSIELRRIGFKWEIAGATALDFANNNFNNSYITNTGIWSTVGWESSGGFSFLATARLLFQHSNQATLDTAKTNFDAGGRIIYDLNKFSFSVEALYRITSVNSASKSDDRYNANIDYQFAKNKILSFSIGKNFNDALPTYSGNLIAYLNLVLGFGSSRKII